MAQASSHFSCSICLEHFSDPVTIPCGHSFCMSCLTDYWDRQSVCSCPQCRATFCPRPKLGRNNLLVEMLEKLGAASLTEGPSGPPFHEVLDAAECRGFEHATFDVSSAHPDRNDGQRLLGKTRRYLDMQIKERETELHMLKQSLRSFSDLAKAAMKDSSRIFSQLIHFLEHRRVEMKALIRAQEKAEVTRAENQLQRLQQQISELRRRDGELEKLSSAQDHNLITQEPKSDLWRSSHNKFTHTSFTFRKMCQAFRSPVVAEAGSSLIICPHVSFRPVRAAISDLRERLQGLYQRELPSITSAVKSINLLQMKATSKDEGCDSASAPALASRTDLLQYFCLLSLDPFTAHRELSLTEGNRTVSRHGQIQDYPDHPDRFDTWGQVLCLEGLQGYSYWEAEWDGQVALGLTYEDIGRKGSSDECRLGHNSISWSLHCSPSSLTVCHGNQKQPVEVPCSPVSRRMGVFLDHNAGLIYFYMVTPTEVHLLHTVKAEFKQPLYPAVWLGAMSTITLCAPN